MGSVRGVVGVGSEVWSWVGLGMIEVLVKMYLAGFVGVFFFLVGGIFTSPLKAAWPTLMAGCNC